MCSSPTSRHQAWRSRVSHLSERRRPAMTSTVNYIQPLVDPMTRALKVRLDVTNPGLSMKPNMFVNVEFGVTRRSSSWSLQRPCSIPASDKPSSSIAATAISSLGSRRSASRFGRPRDDHLAACPPASASSSSGHVPGRLRKPAQGGGGRHGRAQSRAAPRRLPSRWTRRCPCQSRRAECRSAPP